MKRTHELFIQLINDAIYKKNTVIPDSSDWNEIFKLANNHQIVSMIYPVIKRANDEIDSRLMEVWRNHALLSVLQQRQYEEDAVCMINQMNQANIKYLVVKGMVLRGYYPNPNMRTMTDIDILIKYEDRSEVNRVLTKLGYKKDGSIAKHTIYIKPNHLTVEVHTKLSDEYFTAKTENWERGLFNDSIPIKIKNISTFSLSYEDHLLFLFLHMANHIMTTGFGLRQLCDLAVFINANHMNIDWNLFYKKVKDIDISNFISVILRACKNLFGLNVVQKCNEVIDEDKIRIFIDYIISGGVFGSNEIENIISGRYLNNMRDRSANLPNRKFRTLFLIFPPYQTMKFKYKYIKVLPVLLPFAWLHRIIKTLFLKERIISDGKSFLALLKFDRILEEKHRLLKWLELL